MSGDLGPELLVDTSVAVALSVAGHEGNAASVAAIKGRRIGLAGHAAFETFSVLTRLPGSARRTPATVGRLLSVNFPYTRFLSAAAAESALRVMATHGIAGGSVYDALVGSAAAEVGVPLLTRDGRALRTYQAMDVEVVFVDERPRHAG